ncbi:PAS domain S-box protein [Shewanella salipaludis]|uniref:histidine kinase n=1 Tax=Shewanella salipaludis TaxID=2723052 RepID=A0A972JLN2_9GAMM|nr:PAS domain S-box protein [Shewanella salipaludis]
MPFSRFLLSKDKRVFVRTLLLFLLLALLLSAYYGGKVHTKGVMELEQQLTTLTDKKSAELQLLLVNIQKDVQFLEKTPGVQGIVRASFNAGLDPLQGDSLEIWRARLKQIFSAYLVANPALNQIRFIGIADEGQELVRVDRIDGTPVAVADNQLQPKAARDYFMAIAKLGKDSVYISDISLNREHGRLSQPLTPMIRAGMPVYRQDGQLFGMLVLNADVSRLLASIGSIPFEFGQIRTLMVNAEGDYLVHPDAAQSFGFDLGERHLWSHDFNLVSPRELAASHSLPGLPQSGTFYFSKKNIALDPDEPQRVLTLLTLAPESIVLNRAIMAGSYCLLAIGILGLICGGVFYYFRMKLFLKNEQFKLQAVSELETLLRQVIEAAPYAQVLINQAGVIEMVNAQTEALFGYERAELLGKPIETLIPARFHHQHPGLRNAFLAKPETRPMGLGRELYALRKDGSEFPVEIGLSRIDTKQGAKVLSAIVDISERQHFIAELSHRNQALSSLEKRFRQVIEAAPNCMVMTDNLGRIELVNAQTEKLFGYLREELLGQPIEMLIPQRFRHQHPGLRSGFFAKPENRAMGLGRDLYALRKDGSEFPVEIGLSRVDTTVGIKVLSAIVDISERKQFTDELTRRNQELNNFAYVASHDLRSPLRGVDQLATWLEEDLSGKIDPESAEHLRLMRGRISRMEQLLADLLAYARAGRLEGSPELVDTADLVRDTFELLCLDAAFRLQLEGNFPRLRTARVPLELIFRNLLGNAIKHHDRAGGEIRVRVHPGRNSFEFDVIDDGPGIPPELAGRAFSMFQTLRPRDEVEGSGMGLAIVKKTVETFGGTISLTPNSPRGAVFSFSWPDKVRESLPEPVS